MFFDGLIARFPAIQQQNLIKNLLKIKMKASSMAFEERENEVGTFSNVRIFAMSIRWNDLLLLLSFEHIRLLRHLQLFCDLHLKFNPKSAKINDF